MSTRWPLVMMVTALGGLAAAVALAQPAIEASREIALAAEMAETARRFVSSLTPAQRTRATFPFAADERLRWHYVPMARRGIALGALDAGQRHLAYGFLTTALGRRGFVKASAIMALEEVLRRSEHSAARDPGAYFLSVFGEPSASATWGWRLEGHHLSVNLTLVDGQRVVEAPVFLGASPAQVGAGWLADTRVLGREDDLGVRLLASLDDAQRAQAIYRATAPDDILTGPGAKLTALPGLSSAKLTPAQRALLDGLLDEVLATQPREVAERERARITGDLVFSWAGGAVASQPHYYRVSGASFVYELDNTQSGANHIHTVWHVRQPDGDFGADLLRAHLREGHAAPGSGGAGIDDQAIRTQWAKPIEPFRIVGNIYYVGGANVASYLIATSRGLILLDTGPREMTPVVRAGIVKLGFKLEDVKILLTSHAHWDHVEGHAAMKQLTGAQVMALAEEAPALSSGQDRSALGAVGWTPVAVDRVLHDGDDVTLGEVTLRALWTPGHTPGTTTWTTQVTEHGRRYAVVFVGGVAANAGIQLIGNPRHPTIVDDLARTYRVLKALRPDIYLTGHPDEIFAGKLDRVRRGAQPNPLVDPAGYARLVADGEADYLARLRAERAR